MRLYARASNAKHRPKYSLGIICQWIRGLVNSPLLARPAYGSFALCSKDESDTASRIKPFIGSPWRYFSEFCSVLDTTSIGAMYRIRVETSFEALLRIENSSIPCSQIDNADGVIPQVKNRNFRSKPGNEGVSLSYQFMLAPNRQRRGINV